MKNKRSNLGLSILAGGLSFAGTANAIDLIGNGSFENPTNSWKYFKTYNYTAAYYTGPAVPASEGPGLKYGWRHGFAYNSWTNFVTPTNLADHLQFNLQFANSQTVSLTNGVSTAAIDAGRGRYTFSSWLASYGTPNVNPEQPFVVLQFFDDPVAVQVGGNVIFDRTTSDFAVTYADGTTNIPSDLSADHNWIKYVAAGNVPAGARKAKVSLTRSPNAGLSGTPDTYTDLVKLNVFDANDPAALESAVPADGQINVSPAIVLTIGLRDIATQVNTNSIQLTFDNSPVTPSIQKLDTLTTVRYDPPVLLPAFSAHTYKIVWSDNGSPPATRTNQFAFTVAPYLNITLPNPLVLETFDGVAEGSLPSGWSVSSATDQDVPGFDLNNFESDSYTNWVVISRSTLSNLFALPTGGADYIGTTNVAPNQFINGAAVTNLINNNFILAASTDRLGNQVQYLFTGDYNLSGKNNIYLSFHNIYTQNQDSIGSVEYSIDGGVTWLPALYMLDGPDILLDSKGNIDASNTMAFDYSANAAQTPPPPGNYGAFIGVAQSQWATLGPYLSPRVDDDQVESKRVEIIRLAQADAQHTVRFRFAQAGNNSWYFGIDDFGLYSLTSVPAPLVATPPVSTAAGIGNSATFSVSALGVDPLTYQWRHAGTNLLGSTSPTLILPLVHSSDGGNYDVIVSNGGGSTTSSPPAVLTAINPAIFVTGQWDFNGNLVATIGTDLQYYDVSVQTNTTFGTTTSFGISDINGAASAVMFFTPTSGNAGGSGANPSTDAWGGYKMFHGAAANGGGANVNQYTIIFDVLYPSTSDHSWRALLQASPTVATGGDDSEYYINTANGVGISGIYDGNITPDVWHRIALAVDLSGPGINPVLEKFIDGVKVGEQTGGLSAADGRFSLLPNLALLLAEDNGYNNDAYVSSVQFSNGRRSDEFIEALGGPTSSKIPGAIKAIVQNGSVIIVWPGGVPLQSATALSGPWTTVAGATSPYTVPNGSTAKYYRPKIP